jgi:hypothetical protein
MTMPLDEHAKQIVARAEYALQMMHRAAALPRCDWGIGYEEGIETRLPHGQAARVLSDLACLRARLRFEEGRTAEAVNDLVAAITMGRQVSKDGTLILVLVGYGIESRMSETLALYLSKLDAEMIKELNTRIAALPVGGRPAQAIKFEEKSVSDWFVHKVEAAKDKESLVAVLSMLVNWEELGLGRRDELARAFLDECGGTREGVIKFAEALRPCYAQMEKMLDLPLDRFEKEWQRESAKQAGNPVYQKLFPPFLKIRRNQARAEVRRALLSAALAVQLDGRDAFKNHLDPVAGGPFECVVFAGGFELHSNWKLDEKPVALIVGKRSK